MKKIAIIGAGLSGLTLATHLKGLAQITLFEKARGVGGRLSTRYTDTHEFDHGAQYFTVRSSIFRQFLTPFLQLGTVQEWRPKVLTLCKGEKPYQRQYFEPHYVAAPRMNSLCKAMAENLDVKLKTTISHFSKFENMWQLHTLGGEVLEGFDWVISAVPAPQSSQLMPKEFSGHAALSNIEMTGCYSLMVGLDRAIIFPFEAAVVKESPIGWIAYNSKKPDRTETHSLLAQTTNDWAETHLEEEAVIVQKMLVSELSDLLALDLSDCSSIILHRWRYANTQKPGKEDYLLDAAHNLGACGDWCLNGRVESAFLSGYRLANKLKERL